MLLTRVLSAVVLAPPFLAAAFLGQPWFGLVVALAAGLMAWEWMRMCYGGRFGAEGWVLAAILVVTSAAANLVPGWMLVVLMIAAGPVGLLAARLRPGFWWGTLGVLYLGLPLVALVSTRALGGWETLIWLLAVVWATDIGAYAAGRLMGGPLLAPTISPKKTWAGLIGGMASAGVAGWLLIVLLGWQEPFWLVALAPILGAVAQMGDLFESAIKRRFNVKDSSNIIPGHGGLLDRVDGLLAAAVPVALLVVLYGGGIGIWH